MNIERLEHLKEVLAKVKPEEFNMNNWKRHKYVDDDPAKEICGTVCCAFGHACDNKHFQEEGLGWYHNIATFNDAGVELMGFEAAERFFELEEDQAEWLFSPINYYGVATIQDVINRIN